jgi:hypothetical protein
VNGLLSDLWWIAEGDRKEQGGNRKSEDEDVSEAFHLSFPRRRSVERRSCRGHVALWKTTCGLVAQLGEQAEFHLVSKVWIDTSKHIAVQGACPMPNVSKEEEQREGGVAEREPTAR